MDCDHYRLFFAAQQRALSFPRPAITQLVDEFGPEPFLVLIATLLSLRARDAVTLPLAKIIYTRFPTPEALASASPQELCRLITPIGFFRAKTATLINVSRLILDEHAGIVPDSEEALLALPGVGRKTANLVRAEAFGIPAICVDTHVHRIANHFGWVNTRTPEETEQALREIFPEELWIEINRTLVAWGQYICKPRARTCVCRELISEICCGQK